MPPRHAGQVPGVRGNTVSRCTSDAILRQVRAIGYAVSVFRTGDYVERHAVHLSGE